MTTTDIYGFEHDDLDAARVALECALGIRLQGHDSTYLGEYFHGSISSGPSLQLRRNADPMHDPQSGPPEERFAEPEFPSSRLLLFVSGSDTDAIRQALQQHVTGLSFLRRREAA